MASSKSLIVSPDRGRENLNPVAGSRGCRAKCVMSRLPKREPGFS